MRPLNIAVHDLEMAAGEAERRAKACHALVGLLKATLQPDSNEPLPVEALAQALLKLDLCIVHREVVRQAMDIIGETDDDEGLSGADIAEVISRLNMAHEGRAQ